MTPIWLIVLYITLSLTFAAIGSLLIAMLFALASFRFLNLKNREKDRKEFSGAAKYCVYNSDKMASVISLSRRFLYALSTIFMYFAVIDILKIFEIQISITLSILVAFSSAILILMLKSALLDKPAAIIGRNYAVQTISRLSILMYITFIFFVPFEFFGKIIASKILPKKIKNLELGFDYIDVEMMLRADESETESITAYTGKIVKNAFKLQELDVSDVMLPRNKVVYLDTELTNAQNKEISQTTGHTRYPLCDGDLDNCLGIIHIKDINIEYAKQPDENKINFRNFRHQTIRLRENDKLETALAKLLKYKLHMALVEDEFGGVIGVLTLDAALGELVGQIRDEFDVAQDQTIKVISRNKYKINGLATLRRVEDFLDIDFDTDEVSTFGGLVTFLLGRFPEKGERLYLKEQNMRIVIDNVSDRIVSDCTVSIEESPTDTKKQ